MRLGQNDDGAQPLGLEPVVRTGYGRQSRFPGGVEKNRLDGGGVRVGTSARLSAACLVATVLA